MNEVLIPNTLELPDRAELAIHHMTTNVDHRLKNTPYFYLHMNGEPPGCFHEPWDWGDVTGRYLDALVSLRQITGSRTGMDIENSLKDLLVSTLDNKNGLTYRMKTPWSNDEAGMFDQGRTLGAFLSLYMATDRKKYLDYAAKMIDGLWNIAVHIQRKDKGYSYCYYPFSTYGKNAWDAKETAEPTCYGGGSTILPVVKYYEITGSQKAGELAERLVNFIVFESGIFDDTGSFLPPDMIPDRPHFHSKSLTFLGVLKFAVLEKRKDLIEWSRKAYNWAYAQGSSFGWFPEGVGALNHDPTPWSETCCTADMIEAAILLAQNGYPEYWNDVERFTRNYLVEAQVMDIGWILEQAKIKKRDTKRSCFKNAPEMMRGGFVGRCLPHDLIADGFQMGCCCGAGARALYQVWDNATNFDKGNLYVNLLLNKRTPYADIQSHLPYDGIVNVTINQPCSLYVRIPEWASKDSFLIFSDSEDIHSSWKKEYLYFPSVKPGEDLSIRFFVRMVLTSETIQKWRFDILWHGDTIMQMSPKGDKVPLYQRAFVNSTNVPYRPRPKTPKKGNTVHW